MKTDKIVITEFINQLNTYRDSNLNIYSWPDEVNRTTKDVDALVKSKYQKIAIEHTSIDVLPNQRKDDAVYHQVVKGIREELIDKLKYRITILIPSFSITKGHNYKQLRESLKNWLLDNIPDLPFGKVTIINSGLPFQFEVKKEESGPNKIAIGRDTPFDNTFTKRLSSKLKEKSAKLQNYKQTDFKTIILVENSDIQLMSSEIIFNGLHDINSDFEKDSVDEIWFADTAIKNSLEFWLLYDKNNKGEMAYPYLLQ